MKHCDGSNPLIEPIDRRWSTVKLDREIEPIDQTTRSMVMDQTHWLNPLIDGEALWSLTERSNPLIKQRDRRWSTGMDRTHWSNNEIDGEIEPIDRWWSTVKLDREIEPIDQTTRLTVKLAAKLGERQSTVMDRRWSWRWKLGEQRSTVVDRWRRLD